MSLYSTKNVHTVSYCRVHKHVQLVFSMQSLYNYSVNWILWQWDDPGWYYRNCIPGRASLYAHNFIIIMWSLPPMQLRRQCVNLASWKAHAVAYGKWPQLCYVCDGCYYSSPVCVCACTWTTCMSKGSVYCCTYVYTHSSLIDTMLVVDGIICRWTLWIW